MDGAENLRVVVVMPAYYAEKTLKDTVDRINRSVVAEIVCCDDGSSDNTHQLSRQLGLTSLRHAINRGYGANQKTLYDYVRDRSDIVIMVHPDNQYDPSVIPLMVEKIKGGADFVLGDRISTARQHGMHWWRFLANRFLSFWERAIFKVKVNEFHSGLRGYRTAVIKQVNYHRFSDDFVFDTQFIAGAAKAGFRFDEVPVTCVYEGSVSSINFRRSLKYGLQTLKVLVDFHTKGRSIHTP